VQHVPPHRVVERAERGRIAVDHRRVQPRLDHPLRGHPRNLAGRFGGLVDAGLPGGDRQQGRETAQHRHSDRGEPGDQAHC
jgi:hypothetical protein